MTGAPSIVVTGLALRLPGAVSQEEFWQLLIDGTNQTAPVSEHRRSLASAPWWDDTIGEIEGVEHFDAEFFGIDADEARFMDPQHRILMEVAHNAVCDAGLVEPHRASGRRYAVYMALATNAYYPLLCQHMAKHGLGALHPRTIMNNMNSGVAARVSHQYNLTGPVMTVDSACSSFLTALAEAVEMISHARCDGAVVGGANILSSAFSNMLCNAGGIITTSGRTRVFDAEADGTLLGEGAVVVVLEREDIARTKNRRILGRIVAHSINNDGASLNIMAPNPRGQAEGIRDCYTVGVDHTCIGYVEAHGTGTRIGDPIEVNALGQIYRAEDFGERKVGIGSVKSNFGHLLAAAGGVGLAKLLLSLRHGLMAPSLNLQALNPLLRLDETPFEVVTEPRAWNRIDGQPRMGAVTSLGLGGTNVHFVVAEGDAERPGAGLPSPRLCLSAASPRALEDLADQAQRLLAEGVDQYNLAMTLSRFRPALDWRGSLTWNLDDPSQTHLVTACPGRTVRKLLVRPASSSPAMEALLRRLFVGAVEVSDAEARRSELAVVLGNEAQDTDLALPSSLTDHEVAAELFLQGCHIDWEVLFPDDKGTLLIFPPYPFARTAHWLPALNGESRMTKDAIKNILIGKIASELAVAPEEVDEYTSFMRMGISSVQALKIINHLRKTLSINVNPVALFEFNTVEDISAHLAEQYA